MPRLTIATPNGVLSLRRELPDAADQAFLFDLFAAVRADEMALMPLDADGRRRLLEVQFRSMTATYRRSFPEARFEIAALDGVPVGRLITHVRPDVVHYVDIAFLPNRQRGGLATALMRAVLEEPRRLGVPARVNVMAHNIASLRLCQRLGFTQNAENPPYVELTWQM